MAPVSRLFLATLSLLPSTSLAAIITIANQHVPQLAHNSNTSPHSQTSNIPLLLWHGLGDAFDADGIQSVAALYRSIYPNASVHAIALGDDTAADRKASWFGSVSAQLEAVCADLAAIPDLASHASALATPHTRPVNALGFSQGGQFLRGLVQTCAPLRVANLVTFGSQHNGIAAYQDCKKGDWLCAWLNGVARSNTWGAWTQGNVVPAQYFRDPEDLDAYLESSAFLANVNNERANKTSLFAERLAAVDRFVMYMFTADEVVHPRETSWFAEVNATTGDVTPLQKRAIYKEDWLGLKVLDERGALFFEEAPGAHMNVTEEILMEAFKKWMAPTKDKAWHAINDHDAL